MLSIIATPFGYIMRFIYELVGNYGLSIFLFALLAKLIMLQLQIKSKRSMIDMQRIQPKMLELQKKYGKDRQKYAEKVQELYDNEGISMSAGCLPQLIILPIMLGLYYVIQQPLTYFMQLTADEINAIAETLNYTMQANDYTAQIGLAGVMHQHFDQIAGISDKIMQVDFNFLGINLAATPSFGDFSILWIIPILSALTAFLSSFVTQRLNKKAAGGSVQNPQTQSMNGMMYIMVPALSLYFGFILPAGLGVYWISNNLLMMVQEVILTKLLTRPRKNKQE